MDNKNGTKQTPRIRILSLGNPGVGKVRIFLLLFLIQKLYN